MQDHTTHVGLDVHSNSIEVAIADGRGVLRRFGRTANRPAAVAKLLRQLSPDGEVLCFWFEAGRSDHST